MLGLPQVTGVRRLELDEQAGHVIVERETDEGHERLLCPLPALLTVTEGVAPEAFPPARRRGGRARRPHRAALPAADLSDDASLFGAEGSPTWVGEVYSEESDRDAIVARNEPVDASVARLMEYLEERGVFQDADDADGGAIPRGPVRERGESGPIWVVAELLGGEVRPVTLELLGRASELATRLDTNVEAVLLGDAAERHAALLTAHGADVVRLADDSRLARYDTESYTAILARAIADHAPYAVLLGATANGLDLAARLAARLELGLTGDCIGLDLDEEGRLVQLKPAFGGSVVAPILSRTRPQMATVRPGILTPAAPDFRRAARRSPAGRRRRGGTASAAAGEHVRRLGGGRGAGARPRGGERRHGHWRSRKHRRGTGTGRRVRRLARRHTRSGGRGLDAPAAPGGPVGQSRLAASIRCHCAPRPAQSYCGDSQGGHRNRRKQQPASAYLQGRRLSA